MNISIGGRAISKVALSIGGAVLTAIVVAILAIGPDIVNFGRDEWIAFLIAAAGPPAIAYFKKMAPKDILQIIQSIPPDALEQYYKAARKGSPDKAGISQQDAPY